MKLNLSKIHKKYGTHTVLEFDEWKIGNGIYWIKGGNGTGKTTLFRVVSGQTPFDGTVVLNGIDLKKDPNSFRSTISYAEAEPQYPLFIKGKELIEFYREVRNAKQEEVQQLTSLFEMTEFMDQKIGDYSSGMLKKLSLICAFFGDIRLYILDEPLITIDQASAEKLYQLIKEKVAMGCSFLLSSHQEIDQTRLAVDQIFQIKNSAITSC